MSLYEYSLHVVREEARGNLLEDALTYDVVRVDAGQEAERVKDGSCVSGQVRCAFSVSRMGDQSPSPLQILDVSPDEKPFEALLQQRPDEFKKWMWQIAETLDPVYFFMPGG